jgi:hypothetical protein
MTKLKLTNVLKFTRACMIKLLSILRTYLKQTMKLMLDKTRHGEYNLVCPKYNYATEGGKSVTHSKIPS